MPFPPNDTQEHKSLFTSQLLPFIGTLQRLKEWRTSNEDIKPTNSNNPTFLETTAAAVAAAAAAAMAEDAVGVELTSEVLEFSCVSGEVAGV